VAWGGAWWYIVGVGVGVGFGVGVGVDVDVGVGVGVGEVCCLGEVCCVVVYSTMKFGGYVVVLNGENPSSSDFPNSCHGALSAQRHGLRTLLRTQLRTEDSKT
jgi:hypothetical protein